MANLFEEVKGNITKYIVSYEVGSEIGKVGGALIKKEFDTLEDVKVDL